MSVMTGPLELFKSSDKTCQRANCRGKKKKNTTHSSTQGHVDGTQQLLTDTLTVAVVNL